MEYGLVILNFSDATKTEAIYRDIFSTFINKYLLTSFILVGMPVVPLACSS